MQTDRELLEMAAKAAGYTPDGSFGAGILVLDTAGQSKVFSPLTDDAHALRLAVKLGLRVESGRCWVSAYGPMFGEDVLPCAYAATRRAIVRAAAAMAA